MQDFDGSAFMCSSDTYYTNSAVTGVNKTLTLQLPTMGVTKARGYFL